MKNAVVWSEIAVSDLRRATAFYEKLLDGKLKAENFGPYEIALFPHAADGIGGCLMKGEGYEPSAKGTPKEAINTLRDDVVRALAAPDVREKLAAQGAEPSSFTPEEFARFLKEDTRRWTELIRASGIRVEQ